jgi:hypothetical protein
VKIDDFEVKEIIEAPISTLLGNDCRHEAGIAYNGTPVSTHYYLCEGKIIWGATARILDQFLDVWSQTMAQKGGQ